MRLIDDLLDVADRFDKTIAEYQKDIVDTNTLTDNIESVDPDDMNGDKLFMELQSMRQEIDNYLTDYRAYQTAAEQREKLTEKRRFWRGLLSNIFSAIIGGLVVYYWSAIVDWFVLIFH